MKYALLVGEMLIDFIPGPAGSNGDLCYQPHPGGAVANAAVALARLGGKARFVGKLSEDGFGRMLLRVLLENRVDTRFVPTTAQGNTTLALVTLQADGQRDFTFYRQQTADTLLEARDLDARAWEDVAIFHAGSLTLTHDPARAATLAIIDQARQHGLPVSFDVNARPALWKSEGELHALLTRIIPRIALLKFSAEEAHYLDPTLAEPLEPTDDAALQTLAHKLLAQGPSLIIITRGHLGASLFTARQSVKVATTTRRVLDTTGAGDAFMGAILQRLLAKDRTHAAQLASLAAEDLHELGTFANNVAGLSCTRYGGIASLPYLREIEQG